MNKEQIADYTCLVCGQSWLPQASNSVGTCADCAQDALDTPDVLNRLAAQTISASAAADNLRRELAEGSARRTQYHNN